MLHRIFGRAGSGKTEYLINCLKEKQSVLSDCLFLVPEQQSLDTELRLEAAGAGSLSTEVLNFERLPNHVFRHIGGVAAKTVDRVGMCALLCRAVSGIRDSLSLYFKVYGSTLEELAATVSALKRLRISPDGLLAAREGLRGDADDSLKGKLYEVGLIYKEYCRLLGDTMLDDGDALIRLDEALEGKDFFVGKTVFIDGIYTYTPAQYQIIRRIAKSADDLYISFTADEDGGTTFEETMACARKVKELCGVATEDVFLEGDYRGNDEALKYCRASLWIKSAPYGKRADSVSLAKCQSRYDEALRVAAEIYALRERGYRFDQIAIACRHPENYEGVLDAVLEKYGIPFYFARKDTVASKPLGAAITALFEMAAENLPLWAVKKYLKSTFSILDEEEADVLIHYAESWDIRGKAWVSEKDWLMNPAGYTESFTPKQEELLRRVNEARAALSVSLSPLMETLKKPDLTVAEGVKALYFHLKECGANQKLKYAAERLSAMGDDDGAKKTVALWGLTVDIFDRLYELAGDMPTTPSELRELMGAMLGSADVGAIPSYTDAVSIGDARLMRADGVAAMIILGVNEGEFPSLPKKSGLFSARESYLLEKLGIELLPSVEKAVREEQFFFYVCASAPSHYLSVSYVEGQGGRPSPAFGMLAAMFPHNEVRAFGEDERDYMFCRQSAADCLPFLKNQSLKKALSAILGVGGDAPPLSDSRAYIKESGLGRITLSFSRIDCYNNCGFNYLLRYVLNLRDDRSIRFSAVDTGNYMHRVMEEYMKNRMASGSFVPADRDETVAEIEAITADYVKKVIKGKPAKRLLKLVGRLQNAAVYVCESLCDEFCHSAFVPEGFEVEIGTGGVVPPVLITEKGRKVTTRGFIDRLDKATVDGNTYVRIADYKSSRKTISQGKLEHGEGIQMLSYLFAYCDASDEGAIPAGALYRTFDLPKNGRMPSLSGLVLDDGAVMAAMDDRGEAVRYTYKVSAEDMARCKNLVYGHIRDTGERILDGEMCVSAFKKAEQDCSFCPYGEVCRQKKPSKFFR